MDDDRLAHHPGPHVAPFVPPPQPPSTRAISKVLGAYMFLSPARIVEGLGACCQELPAGQGWPRIGSAFEIATRGRVAFCEPVEVPGARMEFTAIGAEVSRSVRR